MKKVTRNRDKILEALREWFRIHEQAPTLEELCVELEMQPRQKATLQRWLQTMRGIDVEWDDNVARSLRLLNPEMEIEVRLQIPVTETLRYLATGLAEWEKREFMNRAHIPKALRLGMSQMYLTSLLQGDEQAPANIPEFFDWAKNPVAEWKPATEIKHLSSEVTLIEDGLVSDFALQWQVTGSDVEMQVQEKVLQDVWEYCRANQLEEQYVALRKLIIECPVLPYPEFRRILSSTELRPLRDFLLQIYVDLVDFVEEKTYYFCPRCKYVMYQYKNSYICRSHTCEQISAQRPLAPLPTISRDDADTLKVVNPGVHRYGTLPGLWELELAQALTQRGVRVTLWPEIDEFDLLAEFSRKVRWAIDVKDWSYLDEKRLDKVKQKLQCRSDFTETFVVFPNEREQVLRVRVRREQLEPTLGGLRLRLISEIIDQADKILNKNQYA
ncbi:Fis family transcriptional regulator [Scytonema hofmannii PCC 7110]|uniref:Fis family transcriptional regulator n=1 Tax=Scytonema hofmannii PCC 7110 TaxID=128403 RepID=A0A139X6C6_9CYAN|nr:hypothetical protein [Scytonema hofmannii]KYC40193.1 Fis family transcriptional regulator [Scytonema hofmannii PCC 7110]